MKIIPVKSAGKIFNDESGFVLVLAMLILVVLVVVGVTSTKLSTIELRIAGNEKVAKQLFYLAESGAYERAQLIENTANSTSMQLYSSSTNVDMSNPFFWSDLSSNSTLTDNVTLIHSLAHDTGVDSGSSLDVTESRIHNLAVYGNASQKNGTGEKTIGIGYKKRF